MTARPRNLSEADFSALVKKRDQDPSDGGERTVRARGFGCMLAEKASSLVGTTAPSPSKYRSKWEETFAYTLAMERQAGLIKAWAYESMTLKLAKGKYHRIDFLIWHLDGSIELAQVKGYHKNLRDSLTHLTWAAQLNPWFEFTLKRREGQGWRSDHVRR